MKLEPEGDAFIGFDRPPYLASFNLTGTPLSVQLVNVHLFFGSPGSDDVARRALEACPERSEGSRCIHPEIPSPFGLGTTHAEGAA